MLCCALHFSTATQFFEFFKKKKRNDFEFDFFVSMYVHTCTKLKLISIDDTISKRGSNNLQQYTFTIGPESPTTGYNNMDNIGQAIIDLILKPGSSLKVRWATLYTIHDTPSISDLNDI